MRKLVMMGLGGGLPKTLCSTVLLLVSLATIIVGISGQSIQSCPSSAKPPSSLTSLGATSCKQVSVAGASPLGTYNLWYKLDNSTSPHVLSVILSVPIETQARWYGMGFNAQQNSMVNTDAIIFWMSPSGSAPQVGTYHITQQAATGVNPDTKRLSFASGNRPKVVVDTNNMYLTYEVLQSTPSNFAFQNFVMGQPGDIPTGSLITGNQLQHQGESSVQIDFVTGSAAVTTVNVDGRRTTHGVLNIIGWGVLLPIGAIAARYARAFDPHWFYVHAFSQVLGYGFVLAGLITGFNMDNLFPGVDINNHKLLGVLLFVLATIQISAILVRPKREAKLRRYWNWGHWWLGRGALVLGAANIFVGIHLANASSKWTVAYGVVLGVELFVVVILEILLWVNYIRAKNDTLPQTIPHNRGTNGASAPPVSETNLDGKP